MTRYVAKDKYLKSAMRVFTMMQAKLLFDIHARMRALPAHMRGGVDMSDDIRPSRLMVHDVEYVGIGRFMFNKIPLDTVQIGAHGWAMSIQNKKVLVTGDTEAFERDMLYLVLFK